MEAAFFFWARNRKKARQFANVQMCPKFSDDIASLWMNVPTLDE
jgi:hypothetical protein